MSTRKAVVVHEEDFSALTIMKPFSDEYLNHYITVFEDAYGEVQMKLVHKDDLMKRLGVDEEGFAELMMEHEVH